MGTYFIKFEDATDLRRRILESSKAGLHLLKSYQELQRVRGEKLTQMYALRQQLRELNLLVNRAEATLPTLTEQDLAMIRQKHVQPVNVTPKMLAQKQKMQKMQMLQKKNAAVQKPTTPRPRTQEERVAMAMADVERRLNSLDQK